MYIHLIVEIDAGCGIGCNAPDMLIDICQPAEAVMQSSSGQCNDSCTYCCIQLSIDTVLGRGTRHE